MFASVQYWIHRANILLHFTLCENCSGISSILKKVNLWQSIDAPGGKLTLNPRYNLAASSLDMTVGYDLNGLGVKIDANADDQKLTLSRELGEKDTISPSITRSGVFALDVKHDLDVGSVTGTFTPSDSVNMKWEDGPWNVNLNAPIDGWWIDGVNISVKRKVEM